MKNICIIPARGGSKRVPRKNIRPLNGIPLISYSIRAAKESGKFDQIVVSSDDKEILDLAVSEAVDIDVRPDNMAGDKVTKVQVVLEYLNRKNLLKEFENVAALLPTCPFRTSQDIINAVELFENNKEREFLIGVTDYEFPIQLALKDTDGDMLEMLSEESYQTTRSQDIEPRYHPNGAIYMANINAFLRNQTFFNKNMLGYKMSAVASYDIDYPYQFEIAEILAKKIINKEISI